MKVLQICHKPPFPAIDGGCLAIKNITCGLINNNVDLKILTIETDKHPFKSSSVPKEFRDKLPIKSVYVDTKVNLVDAFSNIVTSDSYNVSRFFTPDMDMQLTNILRKEKFDVIHLESLFVTPYIGTIRRLSKAKIVLRSHNLEYMIWERLAKKSGNPARKMYLNVLAKQLKKYELDVLSGIDGIVSISFEDAEKYRKICPDVPLINIPFGIDLDEYQPSKSIIQGSFFHLGSLSWKPNFEGAAWFLKEIWPVFHSKHPETRFLLAGRDIPESLSSIAPAGVEIVGEVPDAKDFIASSGIMIVPLRVAGGIRVKIIEGMALCVPVLSTNVRAEGLNCTDGKDILIADTEKKFFKQMERCLDLEFLRMASKNARDLIVKDHDNQKLTARLLEFYQKLLS